MTEPEEIYRQALREGNVVPIGKGYLARARGEDGRRAPRSLTVHELAEVRRYLEAQGQPSFLIEPIWPESDYGILGAPDKAGKTTASLDIGLSVLSGEPVFGRFRVPKPGPVLAIMGEGGMRNIVRRLNAIARAKGIDLDGAGPDFRLIFEAPSLRDRTQLDQLSAELAAHPPRLVILDPLYLAAGGVSGADLYAMGQVLGDLQRIVQDAGAALLVTTHWNKTGQGSGPERFTGVGPGAWGRVLASAAVERRTIDPDGASNVLLRFEITGSEIADLAFRLRRRVRAEDPNDLGSPLVYEVEVTDEGQPNNPNDELRPSERRVLAALRGGAYMTVSQLGDFVAADGQGMPLKARTIQLGLKALAARGFAQGTDPENGATGYWSDPEALK